MNTIIKNGFTFSEIQAGPGISPTSLRKALLALKTVKTTSKRKTLPKNTAPRKYSIALNDSKLHTPLSKPQKWKLTYLHNSKTVCTSIISKTWYDAKQQAQVKYGDSVQVLPITEQSFRS